MDDRALLVAAATDVAAFEQFYRRYVRRVMGFAAQRCTTPADVADVVGQTFLRLLDAAASYDPNRAEPGPFVLGIAANVIRDLHRTGHRQRAVAGKLAGRDLLDQDDVDRITAAVDAARQGPDLRDAVGAVPPGEQEVLLLVAQGHTPSEAAAELGISPAAARTRLSRARHRARRHLDPDTEESTSHDD